MPEQRNEQPAARIRPTWQTAPLLVLFGVGLWLDWQPTLIIGSLYIGITYIGLLMSRRCST